MTECDIFLESCKNGIICVLLGSERIYKEIGLGLHAIVRDTINQDLSFVIDKNRMPEGKKRFCIGKAKQINDIIEKGCQNTFFIVADANDFYEKNIIIKNKNEIFDFQFEELGFSELNYGQSFLLEDTWGILLKKGSNLILRADLVKRYYDEIMKYYGGSIKAAHICSILYFFKNVLSKFMNREITEEKAISIFTIDSEDQHIYFDNKRNKCSDILKSKNSRQDMRLNCALDAALIRFREFDIKPTFMVTGSEIREDSLDAFGTNVENIGLNLNTLKKISTEEDVCIGNHAYDHNDWLEFGSAQHKPLNIIQKAKYFFGSTKNPYILLRYLLTTLYLYMTNRKNFDCELGLKGEFTENELKMQILGLEELFEKHDINYAKVFRQPGFRRSQELVAYLDENGYDDSSDVVEINEIISPIMPYSLFKIINGKIMIAGVKEFPCIFIDEQFRTKDKFKLSELIAILKKVLACKCTVLTIVSHTKVMGGDFGHYHINPRKPLSGLAIPPRKENMDIIFSVLSENSISLTYLQYKSEKRKKERYEQ